MTPYPLFLNLEGKKAAVFGAGKVALRKMKDLLQCGAFVEATSLEFSQPVICLSQSNPRLKLRKKAAVSALLKDAVVAFVASSDAVWNQQVVRECRKRKIWVNVADQPKLCDFFVPAVLKKGRLQVAISTGGASPLLAQRFRQELQKKVRPQAVRFLNQMARLRPLAQVQVSAQKERKKLFQQKVGSDFHFLDNGMSFR